MNLDQPTAETGAEAAPSIEDTLSKTFDAIEARDEGADDEGQDTGTEAGEGAADVAETDTATEEVAETTDQDGAEGAGTADDQPLSPHERWSAEQKAEFAGLPRKAQEHLLKREADITSYLTQESQKLADIKRNYEPLDRIIGPRKEAWALGGYTTETALEHLLALSDFAGRDKPGFIRWFAQQHGVDIGALNTDGEQSQPDPQLTALRQTVEQLQQSDNQRQQQAVNEARLAVKSAVETFAADKSHPYYADVENDIAAMLPGIKQQNPSASHKELLQIAYDKATWVHEPTRAKILADRERLKNLEAANAAKKAKAAAGANVKTSGGSNDGKRNATMDDTMSATYDRMNSGA